MLIAKYSGVAPLMDISLFPLLPIFIFRFLKLFTDLPMEQIARYEAMSGADLNAAKVALADEATRMLHGQECLADVQHTAQALFDQAAGGQVEDLDSLPKVQLAAEEFVNGQIAVVDMLVKGGFAASKNAARRLIALGGARVNDIKVEDERAIVSGADFGDAGCLKLSGSKKKHVVVVRPL